MWPEVPIGIIFGPNRYVSLDNDRFDYSPYAGFNDATNCLVTGVLSPLIVLSLIMFADRRFLLQLLSAFVYLLSVDFKLDQLLVLPDSDQA